MPEGLATRTSLAADLEALGLRAGAPVILHSAFGRLGTVAGGPGAVILAVMDVIGPAGLLMMPTFTGQLSDPATWVAPPVPADWVPTLRANMLPFDPARTPTRNMGVIPELFRTWPDVHRSHHPVMSLAVWGRGAAEVTAHQTTAWALGDAGPMGRFYERDGQILLIGIAHERNSSLHLAETRSTNRRTQRRVTLGQRDGALVWDESPDVANDGGRLFPRIGADFDATGAVTLGRVAAAEARLMSHRALVDFATAWLDRELPPGDNH